MTNLQQGGPEATDDLMEADVHVHTEHRVGAIDDRIFGGFLEHLGRAVYEGVYDPGNPLSDDEGLRLDVLEALRPLGMPVVRYPGGNYVSAYRWRDGIGPPEQRQRRPDYAWRSIESNRFGTDEFMTWCHALGTRPMMAVNLGSAGAAEAAELLEYCNLPTGTSIADERAANGHPEPYGVELWCLGNEMDAHWQAGHVPAQTYAEKALVTSRLMKGLDPSIKTVACGSSDRSIPTYLAWDRIVLEHCWELVDFISAHRYSQNEDGDTAAFLIEGVVVDDVLKDYRGLLDYVQGVKHSRHRVHVSFDEWNVWNRTTSLDGAWQEAPHLLEETYDLQDALVCAQYLHSFIRNADIVKVACLAQIVNVIAPVLTSADGVLLQSIYWPIRMLRDAVGGDALRLAVRCPDVSTRRGDAPVVDAAASFDDATGSGCVSLVNRHPTRAVEVTIRVADRPVEISGGELLHGDPTAKNDWAHPDVVRPVPVKPQEADGTYRITLPGPSHAVLRFALTAAG